MPLIVTSWQMKHKQGSVIRVRRTKGGAARLALQSDNSATSYLIKSRDQYHKCDRCLMSTRCSTGRLVVSLKYIITQTLALREIKQNSFYLSVSGIQIMTKSYQNTLGKGLYACKINIFKNSIRVVSPDDGQVMPETCRVFFF
jgi:hypothetical protein